MPGPTSSATSSRCSSLEKSDKSPKETARLAELADFQKMNQVRARFDATVKDERLAQALKPWYRQFCKRPTFNDEYLPTFNRPNVTLVDTSQSHGVERITKHGVVANGVEYEVDCIIFATGFEISTPFKRRIGFEILGRGGQFLFDHWANGMRTLHGHSSHGFPNWFFVGASQNGISVNFGSTVGEQARHLAYIINEAKARGAQSVAATAEAEEEWVAEIKKHSANTLAFLETCTPGYYNNEGKFDLKAGRFGGDAYAPGANAFNALIAEWRKKNARGTQIELESRCRPGRFRADAGIKDGSVRKIVGICNASPGLTLDATVDKITPRLA